MWMITQAVAFIFWPTCQRQKYNSINFGTEMLLVVGRNGKHFSSRKKVTWEIYTEKEAARILKYI